MTNLSTHAKGDRGEELAIEHLLSSGFSIVSRKYRSRKGEIDCIAHDADGTLVFVEVKSANSFSCGNPLSWVTPAKQRTLARMALQYMAEHKISAVPCRFDVIGIVGKKIDHLRNAFLVR